MNKLRLSMYLCTPSGTKSKDAALLLLSLSILHYFSKAHKEGAAKRNRFATPSIVLYNAVFESFKHLFDYSDFAFFILFAPHSGIVFQPF